MLMKETKETEFRIEYICPLCEHKWVEIWSCACDSECPKCGTKNIEAYDWEEIE